MSTIEKSLAVIGSAGRQTDAGRMTRSLYAAMCAQARAMVHDHDVRCLVSGGAAFADHVAVTLFLEGSVPELVLYLPAAWDDEGCRYADRGDGRAANFYHSGFMRKTGVHGLREIAQAGSAGAKIVIGRGFKQRNTQVADSASMVLAFTFGDGSATRDWPGDTPAIVAGLKPGGTADTWAKASSTTAKRHVDLGLLERSLTQVSEPDEDYSGGAATPR